MSETDERAEFEAWWATTDATVPIHEQLAAIGASVPASAWGDVPPSDSTPASLWAEARALRQQVAAEPQRIAEAVAAEREACASALNISRSEALLACGEMTAQEWRTVSAVLRWMQTRIARSVMRV